MMFESITQILINTLYTSVVYLLVALSFYIIYSPTKLLNLSHAAIITIASYFFLSLFSVFNQFLPAFLLSIISSALMGLIFYKIVFNNLIKNKTPKWIVLIASLGVYIVVQNAVSLIWGDDVKSIRFSDVKVGHEFFGAYITNMQVIIILVGIIFLILSVLFYRFTKIGKQMKAISSNLELSSIFGINQNKIFLLAFGLGSCLAAISGILIAFEKDLTPTFGFNLLLYGVVAMIIGGVGSLWGIVGGAFLLSIAQNIGAYYLDSKWMDAIAYIILILFLIWKPLGFSGIRLKKVEL